MNNDELRLACLKAASQCASPGSSPEDVIKDAYSFVDFVVGANRPTLDSFPDAFPSPAGNGVKGKD